MNFPLKSGFLSIALNADATMSASQNPAPIHPNPTARPAHKKPSVFILELLCNKVKYYSSVAVFINIAVSNEKTNA
jgi:hypothetical protein